MANPRSYMIVSRNQSRPNYEHVVSTRRMRTAPLLIYIVYIAQNDDDDADAEYCIYTTSQRECERRKRLFLVRLWHPKLTRRGCATLNEFFCVCVSLLICTFHTLALQNSRIACLSVRITTRVQALIMCAGRPATMRRARRGRLLRIHCHFTNHYPDCV